MHLPASNAIDRRLVAGALIFGAGWGVAGFCPGPGIVAMAAGEAKAAVFVAAMLLGMLGFRLLGRRGAAAANAGQAT